MISRVIILSSMLLFLAPKSFAQEFNYSIVLEELGIPNFPGIHSYAFAQEGDKWLIIGGRTDGLHARQPFNAFPSTYSNTTMYVVDPKTADFWSTDLMSLSQSLQEQLQSSNMNFHQVEDTLYVIGGYGYSSSAGDHITYPNASAIQVDSLIDAIMQQADIAPYIKQLSSDRFAVTGGQMGYMNGTLILVGGHRFDGRYNPMGHATYTQSYTEEVRKFSFSFASNQFELLAYDSIKNALHFHRRDYNLVPMIFPDGQHGYTLSSGVFQEQVDLPFLYPVDLYNDSIVAHTSFNQYLSNYHSAHVSLFDSGMHEMHHLFFGGISQYYYEDGDLIKDDNVPFVKTISRLSREQDGNWHEYKMKTEMPSLQGASAAFILNKSNQLQGEIIVLPAIAQDSLVLGHILGGIQSPSLNPFVSNNTGTTQADPGIYLVKLVKQKASAIQALPGRHPYKMQLSPNPAKTYIDINIAGGPVNSVYYFITDMQGKLLQEAELNPYDPRIKLLGFRTSQLVHITVVVDHKYFLGSTHMLN